MGTQVFLGEPPASIEQWIIDHHGPVVKETTVFKYTPESGLPVIEDDIVGELPESAILSKEDLVEVEIGSHVTSIGYAAFSDCTGLTSVAIPDSVTSIGEGAFITCTSLTSMTIPNSMTSIGPYPFWSCSGLMSMTFSGKTKATVQGMSNYSWDLPSGCTIHCTDGDITI